MKVQMKWQWIVCFSIAVYSQTAFSQVVGGGRVEARFGVDGDLAADTSLFGSASGASPYGKPSDDWFNFGLSGSGFGVIDTTGAYSIKNLLQASAAARDTLAFAMPMSVPKLTRSGGYILLDALYAKDYFDQDRTVITSSGTKSVDDPNSWTIGLGTVQSKDEIMEFYSHVRRKGLTVNDSLFFYFGVGIHGTSGNKNVAAELFVNDVTLNTSTGKLNNLGPDGGRVAWLFDGVGNVTRVGDMVISISYSPGGGGSFTLEPRIWVHDTSIKAGAGAPVNFDWGTHFDKQSTTDFGFADIVPLSGRSFAQGAANSSAGSVAYAAPWGTIESSASHNWQDYYDPNQFVEVSVNLTTLGVDPALFTGIDPCTVPYRTIVFRSRAAVAFNSNLADFAGPYPFWRYPRIISSIKGLDTLTCTKTSGSIYADSAYSLAWYKWVGTDGGNITGYNADSTVITFDKPGNYILQSAPLRGCFTQNDTVTILADTLAPIATAAAYDTLIEGSVYTVKLYGGDSAASILATSSTIFGPSQGIGFSWTGPSGYTRNGMQPLASELGVYKVTVTELRNGCQDTASTFLVLLPVEIANLKCQKQNGTVSISWNLLSSEQAEDIVLLRSSQTGVNQIASFLISEPGQQHFEITDDMASRGSNVYQVLVRDKQKKVLATDFCVTDMMGEDSYELNVFPNPAADKLFLKVPTGVAGLVEIRNVSGQLVFSNRLNPEADIQEIDISGLPRSVYLVGVQAETGWLYNRFVK